MNQRPFDSQEPDSDGSPGTGEPFFLAVGQLRRPHGVRGEMQMVLYTDFPERLQPGKIVFLGERHVPVTIRTRRMHRAVMLLAFDEYPDRTAVEVLRNQVVYVQSEVLPELPEGEFYQHELLGLMVTTDTGESLGIIEEILETGANDVLLIRDKNGREHLLPYIDEVVLEIDFSTASMRVHILPGLIEGTS
jgi:16S rRNA processing protein RimM